MDIIRDICNTLIDRVGRKAYLIFTNEAAFLALAEMCIKKMDEERSVPKQLITNPGAFNSIYYKENTPDMGKVQQALKKELANQLYQRNLITESEFKKVWPTK